MNTPDWNHIRAFHATARSGSLSAAARQLGLTQPTLSRQVMALEAELGVTLFERIGKRLVLTRTGADLLDHVTAMGEAAQSVALAASGHVQGISGRVRISATDTFAAYLLPQVVARIRQEAPDITVIVTATNALSDLRQREADIAIRHVPPDAPELIGHHLRDTWAHFYAARSWTQRHGLPQSPADLAGPQLLGFDDGVQFAAHLQGLGIPMPAEGFRLLSENSVVIWEMVRQGLGIGAMLEDIAALSPDIIRLLPDLPPIPVPIWLVTHRELGTSRRLRVVHDILRDALSRPSA